MAVTVYSLKRRTNHHPGMTFHPSSAVSVARSFIRRALGTFETRARIHAYWRNPDDGANLPEQYVDGRIERSAFLAARIAEHVMPDTRILEIGCNAGRNLAYLDKLGYRNLTGIEISTPALAVLSRTYPGLDARTHLINAAIEDVIRSLADKSFDLVFTMAVLEHIHKDSEWIFAEIVRTAKTIVVIEDESTFSWRHFPRNYGRVFQRLGARQIDFRKQVDGLHSGFRYRAFST